MSVGNVVHGWKISFKTDDQDMGCRIVYAICAEDVLDKVKECIKHTPFKWEEHSKSFDFWKPYADETFRVMLDKWSRNSVKITSVTLELELKPKYLHKGWQTFTKKA